MSDDESQNLGASAVSKSIDKCVELRKKVPDHIIAAIHGEFPIEDSSRTKLFGTNQNYVKNGGLIYLPSSDSQFERFLKRTRGPVVIDFYAKWLSEAIKEEKGAVKVIRVNVSKLSDIAERYNVSITPTAIGVDCDGEEVGRLTGATDNRNVRNFVKNVLESCDRRKRSSSADRYESDPFVQEHDKIVKERVIKSESTNLPPPIHRYQKDRRRARSEAGYVDKDGLPAETHKHYFFTNESVASKPLTMIPGIGPVYASRMQALGINSAKQLVGIYMQDRNMVEFQHYLKTNFGMNERWARITTEAIETVVRHMI